MHKLPGIVLEQFLKGEHIVHHQDGHLDGIWTDMMIKSTYMRHGKGPGGITGTTTKSRSVQIWSNNLPSCSELLRDLDELRGRCPTQKIIHKEEAEARMTADMKDRNALKRTLQLSVHQYICILAKSVQIMSRATFTNQLKLGINKRVSRESF